MTGAGRAIAALLMTWLSSAAHAGDWSWWRGPAQDGISPEKGIGATLTSTSAPLWTVELRGRGTPAVWGDRVYVWGYEGEGTDVYEVMAAVDLATGRVLWKKVLRDFLSDTIYQRYSIGAPTVDRETGDVYVLTTPGDLISYSPDGVERWRVPAMELLGRLTFPNARTGAPLIVEDLVITHGITSNWGRDGVARDRFYAFDKRTGQFVWSSTPGTAVQDSSWSSPVVETLPDGRLVLYAGTGCGHIVALNARTGAPLWMAAVAKTGVNNTPVLVGDRIVAGHAVENLDSTKLGGVFAFDRFGVPGPAGAEGSPVLGAPVWRSDLVVFSSTPVYAEGVLYQTTQSGELVALDGVSGAELWRRKLAADQLHASPAWADGRLIVPMFDGTLHVLAVNRQGPTEVAKIQLAGNAIGAPAIADGRILVHTTEKLYAFGEVRPITPAVAVKPSPGTPGAAVALRVRPAEVVLRPGESVAVTAELLDAQGRRVEVVKPEKVVSWIPPTAKVRSEMKAVWKDGRLTAPPDAGLTAGAFEVTAKGLVGTFRGRTVSGVPYRQDFNDFPRAEPDPNDPSQTFGWPPLPWIGARFKWEVRERQGEVVLAKTLDRLLFQRSMVFLGHPDEASYTMQLDALTDGNSRQTSAAGVIHQRYIIAIKGNQRKLEVSSNLERFKESVDFEMKPGVWYRLKTDVRLEADGTTVLIRAKAWARDEAEPDAWTLTVRHANGHTHGAPGLFGFTPQNLHKVYLDNLVIAPTGGQ